MAIQDPSTTNEIEYPAPQPLLADGPALARSAPDSIDDGDIEPLRAARRNATTAFEVKYLETVLSRSKGSITRAAALSKVSRQMLQKLMRKHGVAMPR
jgi:DNA-binding NtrC family response regulator